MAKSLTLLIDPEGQMRFIHDDSLNSLLHEGKATIQRASHVEPLGTRWQADLSPVGGPLLGTFATRTEALAAEVAWLDEFYLI